MKKIGLRASRWSHWLHLEFSEDAAAEISELQQGVEIVTDRKTVLLAPNPGNHVKLRLSSRQVNPEFTWCIELDIRDQLKQKHTTNIIQQMSPFGVTECEGEVDGGILEICFPPIHLRRWPIKASPEEWVNLIYKRLVSAQEHRERPLPPPDHLDITRYWVEAHRRVKETQPVREERTQPKVQAACGKG